MQHSPRVIRQAPAAAVQETGSGVSSEAVTAVQGAMAEAPALQAAMRELRQLRAEREQEREELAGFRRSQAAGEHGQGEASDRQELQGQCRLTFLKLRPDNYDGVEPLDDFFAQFELVSRANSWSGEEKALVLAASLRGKARSILDGVGENPSYEEIKSKLELRFGGHYQNFYTQFTNRKIKFGEDYASFGCELEKLARFAYPECSFEIRNKIACAQFIAGLPEGFVKRTLQLEGIASLRVAIERAKVVREISGGENFFRERKSLGEKGNFSQGKEDGVRRSSHESLGGRNFVRSGARGEREKKTEGGNNRQGNFGKECWQCGSLGHFRAECPSFVQQSGK